MWAPLRSPHFCRSPSLTWGGRTLCGESTAGIESPPAFNLPKHPGFYTITFFSLGTSSIVRLIWDRFLLLAVRSRPVHFI
ncbi:hypothetical protein BDW66DRAFT_145250, partial [Aspergillus desertorum]